MSDHRTIVDMPKEELHSSVQTLLGDVDYLKQGYGSALRLLKWVGGGLISVVCSIFLWFFGQVNGLKDADKTHEIQIHDHTEKLSRYDREWQGLTLTIHELERNQRDMMLLSADLKSSMASTAVNVQNLVQRVDGIARLLQSQSRSTDVLDNLSSRGLNGYNPNAP